METRTLDLSPLEQAVASLAQALQVVHDADWFAAQPYPVQRTLLAGVVQNFEFVYELCVKMMRRRLELDADIPGQVDLAGFREMVRLAAEQGLVADVSAWFEFRQLRNITSHTYDQSKADRVVDAAGDLLKAARDLLGQLTARNG